MNTRREHDLAVNQVEPENQAEPYLGRTMTKKKISKFFFQKIKPKTFVFQHVKGYRDSCMYSKNKGGVKIYTNRDTPCINMGKIPSS